MNMNSLAVVDVRCSARLRLGEKPRWLRWSAMILAHSADSWFWLLGLAILWLWGPASWRWVEQVWFAGIVVTAALVFLCKRLFRRQRPPGEWGKIYRATDPHSFPSGHASRAAMLAVSAFGLGMGGIAVFLLVWMPLVGLARVAMGVHYLSDILAGAALGALVGVLVLLIV